MHAHNIFARALQKVIGNLLRTVRVPNGDGLAVGPGVVEVRDVGVQHSRVSGVQFEPADHFPVHVAMHVALEAESEEVIGGSSVRVCVCVCVCVCIA